MFSAVMEKVGIRAAYVPFRIAPQHIGQAVQRVVEQLDIGALDRRIDSVRPPFGSAGTPVAVSTEDMPVGTPVERSRNATIAPPPG